MEKIETYKGFEIRAFEREQGRWRGEIRKSGWLTAQNPRWGRRTPHVDYYDR